MIENMPVEMISELLPIWLGIAVSVVVFIPGLILTLLGISVIIRRSLIESRFGLVSFGIWLLSIMVCAFQIPKTIAEFKDEGKFTTEAVLTPQGSVMVLEGGEREQAMDDFDLVHVQLKGTADSTIRLVQEFRSQGSSRTDAIENAKAIQYDYSLEDSVLTFSRTLEFANMAKFRGQNLHQILHIPYNRPFVMDKSMISILRSTIYANGYKLKDVTRHNYWVFNEEGLLCLTCSDEHKQSATDSLSRVKFKDAFFLKK